MFLLSCIILMFWPLHGHRPLCKSHRIKIKGQNKWYIPDEYIQFSDTFLISQIFILNQYINLWAPFHKGCTSSWSKPCRHKCCAVVKNYDQIRPQLVHVTAAALLRTVHMCELWIYWIIGIKITAKAFSQVLKKRVHKPFTKGAPNQYFDKCRQIEMSYLSYHSRLTQQD